MEKLYRGDPPLLVALPPGRRDETWLQELARVLDAWPGQWESAEVAKGREARWKCDALAAGQSRWVVIPERGGCPGPFAFSLAVRALAADRDSAAVSIVPRRELEFLPELTPHRGPFFAAPFAPPGFCIVKGPLAATMALPDPLFYPYDLAEATFRMSVAGLRILVLPDPSFTELAGRRPLGRDLADTWCWARGAATFRLAHRGRAPRSLRLPPNPVSLVFLSPWLVVSTASRLRRTVEDPTGGLGRTRAFLLSLAELGGTLAAYWRLPRRARP